jgi:hypothetical protein
LLDCRKLLHFSFNLLSTVKENCGIERYRVLQREENERKIRGLECEVLLARSQERSISGVSGAEGAILKPLTGEGRIFAGNCVFTKK